MAGDREGNEFEPLIRLGKPTTKRRAGVRLSTTLQDHQFNDSRNGCSGTVIFLELLPAQRTHLAVMRCRTQVNTAVHLHPQLGPLRRHMTNGQVGNVLP